jgi:DNA primase
MVLTAAVGDVLKQLDAAKDRVTLHVDGHDIPVTNLDKPLWPGAGSRKAVTKRSLLRYLARVSRWMLPHLSDRPLFVTRFPNGIGGKSFYQKQLGRPAALRPHRRDDFDAARELAKTIAGHALKQRPRDVTIDWSVERRRGKIFFDYNPWHGIVEAKQDVGAILGVGGAA